MQKILSRTTFKKDGSKLISGYYVSIAKRALEDICKMQAEDNIEVEYLEGEIRIRKVEKTAD